MVVFHDEKAVVDADADGQRFGLREAVVLDGVFDQELEGQRRDGPAGGGVFGRRVVLDGFIESKLEEADVPCGEVEFTAEGDAAGAFVGEDVAVDASEIFVEGGGAFGIGLDEFGEGVEGVEQEVGIDLGLESM